MIDGRSSALRLYHQQVGLRASPKERCSRGHRSRTRSFASGEYMRIGIACWNSAASPTLIGDNDGV